MTKREFMEMVIATVDNAELREFAESEIEKMNARNAKRANTPSKKAIANEPIKANIAEFLAEREPTVASEIASGLELTVQKVSALCRQMVADGVLTVSEVKVKGKGTQKAYTVA